MACEDRKYRTMSEGVPVRVDSWAGQTDVLELRCVGYHIKGSVGVVFQRGGEASLVESDSAVRIQEISSEARLV